MQLFRQIEDVFCDLYVVDRTTSFFICPTIVMMVCSKRRRVPTRGPDGIDSHAFVLVSRTQMKPQFLLHPIPFYERETHESGLPHAHH